MRFKFLIFILVLCPTFAHASFQLTTISDYDMLTLTKEFSAICDYTSVGPASSQSLWGKELGFIVGRTDTPGLSNMVMRSGSSDPIDRVPHGSLFGALTFPHSVTLEISWLPYTPVAGGNISEWGLGFKWTFTDEHFKNTPFDAAVKVKYSGLDISFPQTINNASTGNLPVDSRVEFQDSVLGAELFVSVAHSSGLFELYGALGFLQAFGRLGVSGPGTPSIFASSGQSMQSSPSTLQMILGANFYPVRFIGIGAEVSREFDRDSINLKLSGQF